ncbi:MAG: hypothetical protein ACLT98_14685 [Eggerthellaceae bacterium]
MTETSSQIAHAQVTASFTAACATLPRLQAISWIPATTGWPPGREGPGLSAAT